MTLDDKPHWKQQNGKLNYRGFFCLFAFVTLRSTIFLFVSAWQESSRRAVICITNWSLFFLLVHPLQGFSCRDSASFWDSAWVLTVTSIGALFLLKESKKYQASWLIWTLKAISLTSTLSNEAQHLILLTLPCRYSHEETSLSDLVIEFRASCKTHPWRTDKAGRIPAQSVWFAPPLIC